MHALSSVPTAGRWGLSASTLKIIACIAMLIDHVGAYIFPQEEWLRVIGRISFPIFAYFIAEGCRYTRHKLKRFGLVFGLALICESVYYWFAGELDGGILLTFSFSILLVYEVQAIKRALAQKRPVAVCLYLLLFAASLGAVYGFIKTVLYISYGFWGVLVPVFTALPDYREGEVPRCFRYLSRLGWKLFFCSVGLLLLCVSRGLTTNVQTWCLMAIPILALYNGDPGVKGMKYGFYLFYPLHLVAIFLLEKVIG